MSTYVISDIHGNYDKFQEMLKKIRFQDKDTLFLLGDVLDRGKQGLKILQYSMAQPNIYGIIGNHEYMSLQCLRWLNSEVTEDSIKQMDEELLQGFTEWLNVGGQSTIDEFQTLDREEQQDILEYLGEFTLYEELVVNNREFVLVHAGIENFDPQKKMSEYALYELIFTKPNYQIEYFPNKYLVTGHTITRLIHDAGDTIYRKNNHIAIDCGGGYDGQLAAICLDTLKEYYV